MVLGLYSLLEAGLLVINAIAILHEERFLNKIGWGRNNMMMNQNSASYDVYGQPQQGGGGAGQQSTKFQIMNLIHSIRTVARIPLIAINLFVIFAKLVFG